ncbi:hypothetical protein NIES4071_20000 [Calothrix sp. NIES-4071]|nr:hypothetical protein NIES4071_20000 [Calothrix sp. NIES-4071]BAZ56333.1 hypothetical protein NIES4105_19950 [Calothrix sp. NIES-4105]
MLYIWLGIIAVSAAIIYTQRQQILKLLKPTTSTKTLAPINRTIFDLEIGDIVQHMAIDWVVEGRLTYQVGAYYWYEYLLQDKDKIAWLSVEEDDRVEVALLQPTNQLDVSNPPPELNFAGETYTCIDSGQARMTRTGLTMKRTAEKCQYFDYESADGQVLSIEVWDGDIEVSVGEKISPRSLTILPGDGRTVYRD